MAATWRRANPFTPTFGVSPPLLAGRDAELEAFADAFEGSVGDPYRAVLIAGHRGSGKTVLLNAAEDLARARGWSVVSTTLREGAAVEVAESLLPTLLQEFPVAFERHLSGIGVNALGFGANVSGVRRERYPVTPTLRLALTALATAVEEARPGAGVLLTLDEVAVAGGSDLQVITQAVQHAFREGLSVAFIAAGLPSSVSAVLGVPGATFIRRAEQFHLGAVALDDVHEAICAPIRDAGREIDARASNTAAAGTQGYPFMIQLIGYQTWLAAGEHDAIGLDHARAGIVAANRRVGRLVHEPALRDVSEVARTFLAAMAIDLGPSQISDIAERLGVDGNYANQYRARLIQAELIYSPARGYVDFTIPGLRAYLREHTSTAALAGRFPS